MNCAAHPMMPATATCQSCGRGLCHECTGRFTVVKCLGCVRGQNTGVERQVFRQFAVSAAFYVVAFLVTGAMNDPRGHLVLPLSTRLFAAYTWGSIYWGWLFLRPRFSGMIIANGVFWFMYFMVKLFLAGMIGFFVAPWQMYRLVREYRTVQAFKRQFGSSV